MMAFCVRTFSEVNFSDVEAHKSFLKENYEWCKSNSTVNDWQGKTETPTNLPSWHPYWVNQVKKQYLITLERIEKLYIECLEDHDKIKYHYNRSAGIETIERHIEELKQKTKDIVL